MENTRQTDPTGILEGYSPHEHYSPPEEERDLVSECMQRFDEAEKARAYWEQDADFFLNFLRGNQLILRSVGTNEVLRVSVAQGNTKRLHSIDNILRPISRALVGKLTRIIPGVEVLPATTEQEDLRSSEIANAFLDYVARKEKLRRKFLQSMKQLPWAGTSILELTWNKHAGQQLAWCRKCHWTGPAEATKGPCPVCDQEQMMLATEQQQQQAQQSMMMGFDPEQPQLPPPAESPVRVNEGDLEVRILDPRDFFPEPGQPDITEMRWTCTRQAIAVSTARRHYGHKGKHIHAEDGIYTDKTIGYYGHGFSWHNETQFLKDHVYLYTLNERPTSRYPKGRLIRIINDMVVEHSEHPLWFLQRIPQYVMRFETNDGEFWGESPIAHAWHMVRERNKLLTQCRTVRELTFNPQKLVPMQSRITQAEWDDQPGRHIRYNPIGGKPSYLEIQQFPAYVYAEIDRLATSVREKFGVTDEEMGSSGSRESGRYAAIQEAQSSEAIAPVMVENGAEWLELHRGILQTAQFYYPPERAWTVTGRDRVISHTWREMNLQPGWDVELVEEDSLSKNPALRLQEAQGLLQSGVFTDSTTGIVDLKSFKRAAGLRLPGVAPDMTSSERAYADSIPERLRRGEPFEPRPWDDCEIMAEGLLAWLRGPGRTEEDARLIDAIGRIWQAYAAQLLQQGRSADETVLSSAKQGMQASMQPQQAQGGGNVMAQGGQPGPNRPQNVQEDAARIVDRADRTGEAAARMQAKHEG